MSAPPPPNPFSSWESFISTVGVPGVALLLILWQVVPRIDHAIELGEHIDGRITAVAEVCYPSSHPAP